MLVQYGYRTSTNQLTILCTQLAYDIYSFRSSLSSVLNNLITESQNALWLGGPANDIINTFFTNYVTNNVITQSVYLSDTNVIAYIDQDSAGTYTITGTQYILDGRTLMILISNPPLGIHYYDVILQVRTSIFPPVYEFDYNTNFYSHFAYTLFKNAYKFNGTKTFSMINTNSTAQEIILPPINSVADGTTIVIKDKLGTAASGPITIYPGADFDLNFSASALNVNNRYSYFDTEYRPRDSTIDGQSTYTISTNYGAVVLIKTNNNWYILSKYTGNAPRGAYAGGSVTKNTTPTVNVCNFSAGSTFYLPYPPNFVGGANGNPHPFVYVIMKHTASATFQVHAARIFGPMGSVVSSSKIDNTLESVYAVIPSANDPACVIFFTDGTDWYIVGYQTATFTAQSYNSTAASGTLTRTDNPKSMVFVNASNTKLINLPDAIPATDKSSLYFVKLLGNIGSGVVQIQSGTSSGIAGRLQFNGRADAFRITTNYGYAWIVGSANTGATLKGYWIVASG